MHKKISTLLRTSLKDALVPYRRVDKYSERSGFVDTYRICDSQSLRMDLVVTGSPVNDSFTLHVFWASPSHVPIGSAFYFPVWHETTGGSRVFSVQDAPESGRIDFGFLVHGRQCTYHFLGRFAADAVVPVEMLYSSGDGPDYRAARVPKVVSLLVSQINEYLVPFVEAMTIRFTGDGGIRTDDQDATRFD